MSIAIVQPYLFPYLGYFQLINTVDTFIFYDDVNYITRGWINRNQILINGKAKYFTIPCKDATQNKLINEVRHGMSLKQKGKLLRKIKFSYGKAPYFDNVFPIIERVLNTESKYIADLSISSIKETCYYLDIETIFKVSSEEYDNDYLSRSKRIIDICKQEQKLTYINPPGGKKLYDKTNFKEQGIELKFIEPILKEYDQSNHSFIKGLSIIDVMMFNSPKNIKADLLTAFSLT